MLFQRRHRQSLLERLLIFLWPRGGVRRSWRYIWHRMTRISASPHAIALGFAAGAFASFTPYIGLHFLLAALIAVAMGGSMIASAFGTIIGNPLTFPLIWFSTYNVGGILLGYERRSEVHLQVPDGMLMLLVTDPGEFWRGFWEGVGPFLVPMTVGSIPLGLAVAAVTYLVVRSAVSGYQHRRQARFARERQPH